MHQSIIVVSNASNNVSTISVPSMTNWKLAGCIKIIETLKTYWRGR